MSQETSCSVLYVTGRRGRSAVPIVRKNDSKEEKKSPENTLGRVMGGQTQTRPVPIHSSAGILSLKKVNGRQFKQNLYKCGGTLINHWYVVWSLLLTAREIKNDHKLGQSL
jgi:hypothetical protein